MNGNGSQNIILLVYIMQKVKRIILTYPDHILDSFSLFQAFKGTLCKICTLI